MLVCVFVFVFVCVCVCAHTQLCKSVMVTALLVVETRLETNERALPSVMRYCCSADLNLAFIGGRAGLPHQ